MADLVWRGAPEELRRRLARLPAMLGPQGGRDAQSLARALGVEMLAILKEAFVEKARGGTDAAGIKWAPLSPKTIAYNRRHGRSLSARRSRAAKAGRASRPLLAAQQDTLWRQVYAACIRKGDDPGTAARKAWGAAKRAGGKTILSEYGGASVEIGRDTGRLLASLSPGSADSVLDAQPGAVRVGSNVEYAPHFHAKRPMWPSSPERFPEAWLERLRGVLAEHVRRAVVRLLQGGLIE